LTERSSANPHRYSKLGERALSQCSTDVLIIGSGAAGLAAGVAARQRGAAVSIVSKTRLGRGGSTARAGGILNAVADPVSRESLDAHVRDTVAAGRYLCDEPQVWAMISGIVDAVPWLERHGVRFVADHGEHRRIRQAGHSRARTLVLQSHLGTGITLPMSRAMHRLGTTVIDGLTAVGLLVDSDGARGALLLDPRNETWTVVESEFTILASGGAGLFYTSSGIPVSTPGDGYALAMEAGCELADLEFVQFYPTVLSEPGLPRITLPYDYLLQRGALLVNGLGEDIVGKHSLADASMLLRSDLARAIGLETLRSESAGGVSFTFDRFVDPEPDVHFRTHRFGVLVERKAAQGVDLLAGSLRIEPMVHHFMGGVRCDVSGETRIPRLLVCGEAATGTHGANRLAGNAFTHAISSGFTSGNTAGTRLSASRRRRRSTASLVRAQLARIAARDGGADDAPRVEELVSSLRTTLTQWAGPCRTESGLRAAATQIDAIAAATQGATVISVAERALSPTLPQLVDVARRLVQAALAREESRGAHVRADFSNETERFQTHFVHQSTMPMRQAPVQGGTPGWSEAAASAPLIGHSDWTVEQE